jgi:Flp pilus assembly pilin Flp
MKYEAVLKIWKAYALPTPAGIFVVESAVTPTTKARRPCPGQHNCSKKRCFLRVTILGCIFFLLNWRTKGLAFMKKLSRIVAKLNRRSGQSLVEYALILALVSIVAILVLQGVGSSVNTKLSNVNGNMQ